MRLVDEIPGRSRQRTSSSQQSGGHTRKRASSRVQRAASERSIGVPAKLARESTSRARDASSAACRTHSDTEIRVRHRTQRRPERPIRWQAIGYVSASGRLRVCRAFGNGPVDAHEQIQVTSRPGAFRKVIIQVSKFALLGD